MPVKKKKGSTEAETGAHRGLAPGPGEQAPSLSATRRCRSSISPPMAPLPRAGDIIHLPRNVTGDTKKQAFGFGGTRTPFRVVECSHVYARERTEKVDTLHPTPAVHVKTTMHVRRLSPKEVYDDRGWEREPGSDERRAERRAPVGATDVGDRRDFALQSRRRGV